MFSTNNWTPHAISAPANVLILSDLHIPFADRTAVRAVFGWARKRKISHIILNGDIADFYAVSRWETDPEKRNFAEEISAIRTFLAGLRHTFPKAKIVYKLGNHEERYERFLRQKAPELLGCDVFSLGNVLRLERLGIQTVSDKRPIRLGRLLTVIHGHEYSFQISNPVNPARGYFLRSKSHVLGAHFHQTSQHSERTIDQKVIAAWSTGCLCDLHPEYRPLNNWNHGFAFVEVTKSGGFQVHNFTIIDGKIL